MYGSHMYISGALSSQLVTEQCVYIYMNSDKSVQLMIQKYKLVLFYEECKHHQETNIC